MRSAYYQIVIWVVFPNSSFNITEISLNFEGVINEKGRYPFTKILMDVVYIHNWVINSLYKAMYLSCTILK